MTVAAAERLEIRHVVGVPPEDAFDAWTTPELVEEWWGPHGYRTEVLRLDAVEGGRFSFRMIAPSGATCPMSGTYTKVDRPRLLVFEVTDHCVADMPGDVRPPSRPSLVEVRFEGRGESTEIILAQTGLDADYRALANVGWSQSLQRAETALR